MALCEPDDFTRFHVELAGLADDEAEQVLAAAGAGHLAPPDHCWIAIDFIKAAAALRADADWSAKFAALLGYAASKGWIDESGLRLRGHLVRV